MHPVTTAISASSLYAAGALIWTNNHPSTTVTTMTAAGMIIIPLLGIALHLVAIWLKQKAGIALPIVDDTSAVVVDTNTTTTTTAVKGS